MWISLNLGPADVAAFALIISSPGLGVGALCGAIGWREHRIWGGILGAIIGSGVCLSGFIAWINSDYSTTLSYPEAVLLWLKHGLPGLLAGAAIGAWLWRSNRFSGIACGALAGVVLWLSGWCYFTGTL